MELKYCERCGGLWLRECGAGVVYCDNCLPELADLPIPKKRRLVLPVRPHTAVEDFAIELGNEEDRDFEAAAGGAA